MSLTRFSIFRSSFVSTKIALGIDVGGSGIKGVDLETGQLLA